MVLPYCECEVHVFWGVVMSEGMQPSWVALGRGTKRPGLGSRLFTAWGPAGRSWERAEGYVVKQCGCSAAPSLSLVPGSEGPA